jgi:hypothetical protein
MPRKISKKFVVSEVFNKIGNVLLMIIEVYLTFLLCKSSRLQRKHPLTPPPIGLCRGWGRSGSFHLLATALVMAMK